MRIENWGLIRFADAWDRQRELAERVYHGEQDTLVFCEHPDVITLGRNTKTGSLLASRTMLRDRNVDVIEINRGGEATVHNPGQLVGYPVCNLQRSKPDLHWFLRTIEEAVIQALDEIGIASGRVDGLTGVWIQDVRKICAIGIHCSRWITTHGFALNVNNDLSLFNDIIPCGIVNKGVTSVSREIGAPVPLANLQDGIAEKLESLIKSTKLDVLH